MELPGVQVLVGRGLLVRHPLFLAGIDLGDEAEIRGVAGAGRSLELVDHPAIDPGNAGALVGFLQRQVVDGPVWRQHFARRGERKGHR